MKKPKDEWTLAGIIGRGEIDEVMDVVENAKANITDLLVLFTTNEEGREVTHWQMNDGATLGNLLIMLEVAKHNLLYPREE